MIIPAAVAAILVQTSFYSIYLIVFIASTYILLRPKQAGSELGQRPTNVRPLAVKSSLQLVLVTALWIVNIIATFSALEIRSGNSRHIEDHLPLVLYHGPQWQPKVWIYVAQNALFEAFLVYRLYTLCGKSFLRVSVPAFCAIGSIVLGVMSATNAFHGFSLWLFIAILLTVVANLVMTVVTFLTIRGTHHATPSADILTGIASIACTLVESAGLYTFFAILAIIFIFVSGDSFESFFIAMSPIIGINYALVVVLIDQGLSAHRRIGLAETFTTLE